MPLNHIAQKISAEKAEIAATISLIAILVILVVGSLSIGYTWEVTGILSNTAKIALLAVSLGIAVACNEALILRRSHVAHFTRIAKISPRDIPNYSDFNGGTAL